MKYTEKYEFPVLEDDDISDLNKYTEELTEKLEQATESQDDRINRQLQNMTLEDPSSAEIVDARGSYNSLEDRLNANDTEVNSIKDKLNKKVYYFTNVDEMKQCSNLKVGDVCQTLGYYEADDGGQGLYQILNDTSLIDDGGSIHDLANELKAKLIVENNTVNVKQFGAKGDGITDDSEAIKNAFAYNGQKTSKIVFGKGQYNAKDTIFLYSNTEIDLQNATIYNCASSVSKAYGGLRFINSLENLQSGYGNLKNIIIKNGCFDADFKNIVFVTFHCDNLQVQNVHFKNAVNDSHIFDMGGCRNVLIENCLVDGFMYSSNSREAFQIDFAGFSNSPYWVDLGYISQENVGYDSLPCKNVTIRNCIFEKGNGTSYPVAIGNHGYYNDYYHEKILIEDCKFDGFYNKAISLYSMNDITIRNNEFNSYEGMTSDHYAILVNPVKGLILNGLIVDNNKYTEISDCKASIFVAIFNSVDNSELSKNIIISNNVYEGCYDGVDTSSGGDFIQLRYVDNILITNNIINNPKNIIFSISSSSNGKLTFSDNIVKNYRTIFQGNFSMFYARNNSMIDNCNNEIDYSNIQEYEELWTNPDITANFESQTITLNNEISNYKYFEILYASENTNTATQKRIISTGRIPISKFTYMQFCSNYMYYRVIGNLTGTSMYFDNCKYYANYGGTEFSIDNSKIIPFKVIGYKN